MKCIFILATFIIYSVTVGSSPTGLPLLLTPGDNSNFKPGDRYIWFPDGRGNPVLADLHEEVNTTAIERVGANNQYVLYTRAHPSGLFLPIGNQDVLQSSTFDPNKPTVLFVHGWTNQYDSESNVFGRDAFLQVGDYNVIVSDWSHTSYSSYAVAVAAVPSVGQHIANFVTFLISNGLRLYNFQIVGHSLGAHIAGNVGRTLEGKVAKITGLDPAGPSFTNNVNRIAPTDALFVEIIHTDPFLGLAAACGDADFYPNGGRSQPGCSNSDCNHGMAYQFFASTVKYNRLIGYQCDSVLAAQLNICPGPNALHMGNRYFKKYGVGIYRLGTTSEYPFY